MYICISIFALVINKFHCTLYTAHIKIMYIYIACYYVLCFAFCFGFGICFYFVFTYAFAGFCILTF